MEIDRYRIGLALLGQAAGSNIPRFNSFKTVLFGIKIPPCILEQFSSLAAFIMNRMQGGKRYGSLYGTLNKLQKVYSTPFSAG